MHAVERLDSLLSKVDGCPSPMYVLVIYRYENRVFAEYVDLEREKIDTDGLEAQVNKVTFFVHFAKRPFSYPSFSSFVQKNVLK